MDVIGIENPVMDFLVQAKRLPSSNEVVPLEKVSWQGGGNVSSAIVAAARLGAVAGMIGVVVDDPYGYFCINDFKRHSIDVSHIIIDKQGSTVFCVGLVESLTKMRSFIYSGNSCRKINLNELDKEYIISAKYLHIGNMGRMDPATVQAAKWAKENGVKVSIDAGYYYPETEKYLDLFDVFIVSEFYYEGLFDNKNYKENCAKLQSKGPEIVMVTLGEKGSVGIQDGKYFEMPTFNEVQVIDTTGAGDVFHGAFIYGLLQGWNAEETAKFSSAVSSINCTRLGGRAAIPDRAMVDKFIIDRYIDYTSIDERVRFYENGLFRLGGKK
ncbi:MAG: carbohydrate kinase family protein [Actinobacteria bacterium]|nr:carbohydrate kinase family protein [Actinomycetota bacterium]